ncbi:tyrosine-type recombinase/integrase [Pseudooceanicola nanhaiensis]|uniref:tyrosine-type recombinase/integrase n=1 Tax=Pseudooceanicola nanhaiensis TaxID=375761 RepID=UPI001CD403F3|nr:site-specific integrase [Pseudooceanicola nanhaiensis]MCA0919241.1 site-specific integrase [Pseudooceanicola nanhaiensis]
MTSKKRHPENVRLRRRYQTYLREAKRLSERTVNVNLAAIERFEASTGYKPFKQFHIQQAVAFKDRLRAEKSEKSGQPLSAATMNQICQALRTFAQWLSEQPGYRRAVRYSDADYFNLSNAEQAQARSHDAKPSPTLDQIRYVLTNMPSETDIQLRDRAVIAFLALTGIRVGALITLKMGHVNLHDGCVYQDGRQVDTKFRKTSATSFFPIGEDITKIFEDYVNHMRNDRLFGPDDPLFSKVNVVLGESLAFQAADLSRAPWKATAPVGKLVRDSFLKLGLPKFGPHSFRKTLARLGTEICSTPEEMKAWSQNLSHEHVMTTFNSYGNVLPERQAHLLKVIGEKRTIALD